MSLLHVIGFGLKVGHLLLVLCCWIVSIIYINWFISMDTKMGFLGDGGKMWLRWWEKILGSVCRINQQYYQCIGFKKVRRKLWRKLWLTWVLGWCIVSLWIFCFMNLQATEKRKETLASMCDERARMLQDQFNVSMNHIQAMSILISTFHHAKDPSAIDQRTFAKYTERTAFERPLTSGVAYAVRVLQSEREQFEKQQGWSIKRMDTMEQNPVHEDDYVPDELEPSPIHEEYAPVIFAQDTISHVISIDVLSGKEDRENVLRARESGKGVLTAPFRLLKTNRLGVILTFAVYKRDLPSNATPNERIQATDGYLGGVFEIESLVEKLLQQLASKQTVIVSVYDTTNHTHSIPMYGSDVSGDAFYHVSFLNFGDPFRKHEMHCRFKQKPPWPWLALGTSFGILVIVLLVGHICHATVNRIATIEEDCRKMTELKKLAEAADVAKSQFLATVSHEIRTPMNGVLGMMNMLMDTDLDVTQQEYVRTAQGSGKALVSIINEVLDQAKIDSGKLELEAVMFDIRAIMDDVLSLFSEKSQGKGVELAVYVSDQVPQQLIGDPGRFRQIITNLMGNSVKFTDKGHIFVTIHLVEEVFHSIEVERESSKETDDTLSGSPVAHGRRSWEGFKAFSHEGPLGSFSSPSSTDLINLIVSVEDTGEGIPLESQEKIFTPFTQVNPSISRKHGGTGIGLSISKCLVGLMKGEIGFASEPGIGSTFTFTAGFTNACPDSNEIKTQKISNQPHPASSEFNGMTALVIDPRPVRAKVSRYHIQRLGIHVEIKPDLKQGLSTVTDGNVAINMVLIEQEVWERDTSISSQFVNNIKKIVDVDKGIPPKLFILVNSASSFRVSSSVTSCVHNPTVVTKPLRASMLAASLQRAMGVGNKGNPRNGEHQSLSLHHLLSGRKILIVDDNSVNRTVAAGALKKYGAGVVCVSSGKEAISMLKPPHQFDACFMDIQMPEMDGFEATQRIRKIENNVSNQELYVHLPILAMTADVMQATQEECLKYGMDGYVSKPFEAEQLYREVSKFFQSS
ncbi:histidine kinase 3-like [Vicia villosa]|uniref:histidine kinase 3-like n=1 Tax=Vicia villosa TaxID=3911 RepID=UPI00273BD074|nr:histidine kinase 3-like [Vicia villosa]